MKYLMLMFLLMVGCSDSKNAQLTGDLFGRDASITCYSGGKIILQETKATNVLNLGEFGWFFKTQSGNNVKIFAECFIVYTE